MEYNATGVVTAEVMKYSKRRVTETNMNWASNKSEEEVGRFLSLLEHDQEVRHLHNLQAVAIQYE